MLELILRCNGFPIAKQRSRKIGQMLAKLIRVVGLHVKQVGAQIPLLPLFRLGSLC